MSWPTDATQSCCHQHHLCHSTENQRPQAQVRIPPSFKVFVINFPQLTFYYFSIKSLPTLHGIQHISAHRHNPERLPPMPPLPQHREAVTASPGKNSPSFNVFVIDFPWLTFYYFQSNCYATLHMIHILAHRRNSEPLTPMLPSLQHTEAATVSTGKDSPYFQCFTSLFPLLTFY